MSEELEHGAGDVERRSGQRTRRGRMRYLVGTNLPDDVRTAWELLSEPKQSVYNRRDRGIAVYGLGSVSLAACDR